MKDLVIEFVERCLSATPESTPATLPISLQPPKVFTEEPTKLNVVPGLTDEQAIKLFGKDAAQVYIAARRRIQEKGYPDAG